MPRLASQTFKDAIFSQETSEVFILLLTIDHADLADPIRVCSDSVSVISRGETFINFPFDLSLPIDSSEGPPRAQLTIDNVDRQIVQAIRSITSPATVLMEIVLSTDLETVEMSWPDFEMISAEYDFLKVSGELTIEQFISEPWPQGRFLPSNFPGVF